MQRQEEQRIAKAREDAAAAAKVQAEAKAAADAAEAKQKSDAELAAQEAAVKAAESQKQAAVEEAERGKQQLRARLLEQFNSQAREDLARLSGIVLNYPSLHLTVEGHTDSTGSAEFNQSLSEKRADAVHDYLISQGRDAGSLSAQGLGTENPVADNSTSESRQKNVESRLLSPAKS